MKAPEVIAAEFAGANVDIIGPSGNISAVLFIEKEGFGPLFKAVNLADCLPSALMRQIGWVEEGRISGSS